MTKKSSKWFAKGSWSRLILINMCIAAVIAVVGMIVLIVWLRNYTQHGVEVEVPQVTGLYLTEAETLLKGERLNLQVIDSTFTRKVPLGTIVEQTPPAQSHAKCGRTVYVIVNATQHKHVVLPEVHDMSYRQAENMLKQLGLQVGDILYEPSQYRDLVIDLRLDTMSLEAGARVEEGSVLTMVIGQGQGTEMVTVPDLRGKHLYEIRSLLLGQRLTLGAYTYDEEPTDDNRDEYIVYAQQPDAGMSLLEGSSVTVQLSTNIEKAVTEDNEQNEENFF